MTTDPWLIVNAIVSFSCSLLLIVAGLFRNNGRGPIRVFEGAVLLYFAVIYTLAIVGIMPDLDLGKTHFRMWINLLFIIPALEAYIDWGRPHHGMG